MNTYVRVNVQMGNRSAQQAYSQELVVLRKLRRMNQVVPETKHRNVMGSENSEQTARSDPQQQLRLRFQPKVVAHCIKWHQSSAAALPSPQTRPATLSVDAAIFSS